MAEFVPRLTDKGMQGNKYWYSENPFYLSGNGLPNCTCYAWGRFFEISGIRPQLSLGNAEDWYGHISDGYIRGDTPQLGAIICLANGPFSGMGHVAVVEEIKGEQITFSNSAYGGQYFYITHGNRNNNYGYSGYDFQGFIYNPHEFKPPTPTPTEKSDKMPLWFYLRKF